jgi:hypothetical protein
MTCTDCNIDTYANHEYYMLRNDVWAATGHKQQGYLCIGCVEQRLGRTLTRDDFTDVLLNNLSHRCRRSERLTSGLQATTTQPAKQTVTVSDVHRW